MARHPGIWLIDGRAGGEGAVIAAAAYADGGARRIWAARASQWLSSSDFMGRGYRLSVHDPAEARAVLDRLGVTGTVSIAEHGQLAYPHSGIVAERGRAARFRRHAAALPRRRRLGRSRRRGPRRSRPTPIALAGASGSVAAMATAALR